MPLSSARGAVLASCEPTPHAGELGLVASKILGLGYLSGADVHRWIELRRPRRIAATKDHAREAGLTPANRQTVHSSRLGILFVSPWQEGQDESTVDPKPTAVAAEQLHLHKGFNVAHQRAPREAGVSASHINAQTWQFV